MLVPRGNGENTALRAGAWTRVHTTVENAGSRYRLHRGLAALHRIPMTRSTTLLNDDGSASVATALMMSHHGFRRDLGRFEVALEKVSRGDASRVQALRDEWTSFRNTLHGHHESEDTRLFPFLRDAHAALAPVIERLSADHRRIDPLLEQGDRAFAALPETSGARSVVLGLSALLDEHLQTEEASVIPHLRETKAFPPPATDAEAELYSQGFAWASHGVAKDVLEKVYAMLPDNLRSRLPAALEAFEDRCVRAWGTAEAGASRTSAPE